MKSWLDIAHDYWKTLVREDEILIDATCGNGHDTLFLAKLKPRLLYSLDIQPQALSAAQQLLSQHLTAQEALHVTFIEGSHAQFPTEIAARSVKLIVYNLGYLPGGNKSITTLAETTLHSLKGALELIIPGGAISVTCYPGHPEGKREEEMILNFAKGLDPKKWSCCHHRWINRNNAPSVLFIHSLTSS
jgi:tRNA G37 N-methylase Trm5